VVGGEEDQRIVQLPIAFEFVENPPDLAVDEGDGCVVIGFDVAHQLVVDSLIAVFVAVLDPVHPRE